MFRYSLLFMLITPVLLLAQASLPDFVLPERVAAAGSDATPLPEIKLPADPKLIAVASADELKAAAGRLAPGDIITIAPGVYSDVQLEITTRATADRPAIIRGANGAIFTGQSRFTVSGSYIILQDLAFKDANIAWGAPGATYGTAIKLSGDHNVVHGCTFSHCGDNKAGWRHIVHLDNTSNSNRVEGCRFTDNLCIPTGLKDGPCPGGNVFSHNLIDGNDASVEKNWRVAIQIGQGRDDESRTTIEYNTVKNFDGPESIGLKSSFCIVRNNLVLDSAAPLGVRAGHDNQIRANVILHSMGGIMVNGSRHIIEDNIVVNDRAEGGLSPIFLTCEGYKDGKLFCQPATDCLIRRNILAVLPPNQITPTLQAFNFLEDVRDVPRNNRIEDNTIIGHRTNAGGLIGLWDDAKKMKLLDFIAANTFKDNTFWTTDAADSAKGAETVIGTNGNRIARPAVARDGVRP